MYIEDASKLIKCCLDPSLTGLQAIIVLFGILESNLRP